MSTFEDTRSLRNQTHFEVLEIDLPVINGACTIGSADGFGTPLSCDQAWTGEYKTYKFTNTDAPILQGSIYRCIRSISETSVEIKPGDGLASRASLNVVFADFKNQDPNPSAAGVTDEVKAGGTFFGKLNARQIFENKQVRLKLYRVEPDGSIDLVNGSLTRYYLADAFKYNPNNDQWTLQCKDALSIVNLEEKTWPISDGGYLRQDIDDTTTSIPVDPNVDYSSAFVVRLGDEFMEIISVTDNQTATATLNVGVRGVGVTAPVSGELLTLTAKSEHSAGDEVFICEVSDDETIDALLARILIDSDMPASLIPTAEWAAEVAQWHANDKINTIHSESEDVNDVINRILIGFLMDMWFDVDANKVKLSAISVWKQSSTLLTEGKEVIAYSVRKKASEALRASRAMVLYDKRSLANDEEATSYKKGSRFSDSTVISDALYGKHKDKVFDNNFLIDTNAAELLTQRYVSRFRFTPFVRSWETNERYLTYKTGDVVDLFTTLDQSFDGSFSGNIRSQILSIKTKYTDSGRMYEAKAMSYEAAFDTGTEIVISEPVNSVNLYTLAGAPPSAVELTFVFDGSYSYGATAIRAGQFPAGSKIIIVLANGADLQASGGQGGRGSGGIYDGESESWIFRPQGNGKPGGVVYDAQGVDTDIYFSGATPSVAYPIADGYLRAPSGGAGGFVGQLNLPPEGSTAGNGGNGGDGRSIGLGGSGGEVSYYPDVDYGDNGTNGAIDGSTTGWGVAGADNAGIGGAAGSGVVDNGAAVVLYGADASRYINGNGDH